MFPLPQPICGQYDVTRIALVHSDAAYWWWLRLPGINNHFVAAVVCNDGETKSAGGINIGGINTNIVDGYFSPPKTVAFAPLYG